MQDQADRKLQTLTTIVYSVPKARFELEEAKASKEHPRLSRQQTHIENLRRELRQMKRRYRVG
ncbi:hypothetical protein DPMN_031205 [Dreissena polymorpha]|uniref:Uncharacterized protein n=1 Tax=Dreissena polymorpha TaxID=45954 RepID=A0A9D4M1S0_DREPO|nr:hypothetical protein DPMN_031205 [Dreissena polymorpha]